MLRGLRQKLADLRLCCLRIGGFGIQKHRQNTVFFDILNPRSRANPRNFYVEAKNNLFLVLMGTCPRLGNSGLRNLVFGSRRQSFCRTHGKISLHSAILIILLMIF